MVGPLRPEAVPTTNATAASEVIDGSRAMISNPAAINPAVTPSRKPSGSRCATSEPSAVVARAPALNAAITVPTACTPQPRSLDSSGRAADSGQPKVKSMTNAQVNSQRTDTLS